MRLPVEPTGKIALAGTPIGTMTDRHRPTYSSLLSPATSAGPRSRAGVRSGRAPADSRARERKQRRRRIALGAVELLALIAIAAALPAGVYSEAGPWSRPAFLGAMLRARLAGGGVPAEQPPARHRPGGDRVGSGLALSRRGRSARRGDCRGHGHPRARIGSWRSRSPRIRPNRGGRSGRRSARADLARGGRSRAGRCERRAAAQRRARPRTVLDSHRHWRRGGAAGAHERLPR